MDASEFRTRVEAEIAKTEALIEEYQALSGPVAPDVAIGRVSRMDAINNKSITEAALRQAESKLNKLKHALTLIGTPDFGKCQRCGQTIPLGRILIRPESAFCVQCAS